MRAPSACAAAAAAAAAALLLALQPRGALALRELATRHAAVHAKSRRLGAGAEGAAAAAAAPPTPPPRGTPGVANCTLSFFEQQIDHFNFASPPTGVATYQQRVFTNEQYWRKDATGAVFFYAGNEADVTLYVEHTGLIWENAAAFGAKIVFAEHRCVACAGWRAVRRCAALCGAALRCAVRRCAALCGTVRRFAVPRHTHCTALHCIALHCTALHCAALRCAALRCAVPLCANAVALPAF